MKDAHFQKARVLEIDMSSKFDPFLLPSVFVSRIAALSHEYGSLSVSLLERSLKGPLLLSSSDSSGSPAWMIMNHAGDLYLHKLSLQNVNVPSYVGHVYSAPPFASRQAVRLSFQVLS